MNNQPAFDSGFIHEPLLQFGNGKLHVDPKVGLSSFGPYFSQDLESPTITQISLGIIGPPNMIADAEEFIERCKKHIGGEGSALDFPGFNSSKSFMCKLSTPKSGQCPIMTSVIHNATSNSDFQSRITQIASLYSDAVKTLSERDPKPSVNLCCLPQTVVDFCTIRTTKSGVRKTKLTKAEKKIKRAHDMGQGLLFEDLLPDDEPVHQNLRRLFKAKVMEHGLPTQIIWPRTISLLSSSKSQDLATRAWNLMTALYHKAGGTPWRLAEISTNTCFVGISFFRDLNKPNRVCTSMAQAFTSTGDGYVLRGDSFEWDERKNGKTPHLSQNSSRGLLNSVLKLFQKQNQGVPPSRIVVHKSSKFWSEEIEGSLEACEKIPIDLIALGQRGIQFLRTGDYPALRGTYIKLTNENLLLYSTGYNHFYGTYHGPRIAMPLEVVQHIGDSSWKTVLKEILSLTKMNWNTANYVCSQPITLYFSRKVGEILAEAGDCTSIRSEYRFYM